MAGKLAADTELAAARAEKGRGTHALVYALLWLISAEGESGLELFLTILTLLSESLKVNGPQRDGTGKKYLFN